MCMCYFYDFLRFENKVLQLCAISWMMDLVLVMDLELLEVQLLF